MIYLQYIRVSSEEQAKGGSLGAQKREGEAYALKLGVEIEAMYCDAETAKSEGREQYGLMLDFVKKCKKPVVILVEKTDRLYRNLEDHTAIMKLISSKGLTVHFYKEGEILGANTSSHKKLMHRFKLIMAANYVENLSEEIIKGRTEKLLNGGYPHRAPVGYKNDRNTRTILVDDLTAPYVKEAYSLFSSGLYSLQRLTEKLFELGILYKDGTPKMSKSGLQKMLRNPFYIGDMEIKGVIYKGNHDSIIPVETWLAVQQILGVPAKPLQYGTLDFRYGHLLRCHLCGSAMVGENKKEGRYTYYRCSRQKYGCEQGYISEKKLDKMFDAMIESLKVPDEWKAAIIEAATQLEPTIENKTSVELSKVNAERSRLRLQHKKAFLEKLAGKVDDEFWNEYEAGFQESIRKLDARKERIEAADIGYLRASETWVELPEILAGKWFKMKTPRRVDILNMLGSNFSVEAGNLHYELKEPFTLLSKTALCSRWWSIGDSNS